METRFIFSFERLNVWQDSRSLATEIYQDTKNFSDEEKFGLTNQMRRAAVSVSSNIAEGTARTSQKDQAHFYQLAYSSLMELMNQIIISNDLGYISDEMVINYRTKIEKVANMLKEHLDNVLTYCRHRVTNAVAEGHYPDAP